MRHFSILVPAALLAAMPVVANGQGLNRFGEENGVDKKFMVGQGSLAAPVMKAPVTRSDDGGVWANGTYSYTYTVESYQDGEIYYYLNQVDNRILNRDESGTLQSTERDYTYTYKSGDTQKTTNQYSVYNFDSDGNTNECIAYLDKESFQAGTPLSKTVWNYNDEYGTTPFETFYYTWNNGTWEVQWMKALETERDSQNRPVRYALMYYFPSADNASSFINPRVVEEYLYEYGDDGNVKKQVYRSNYTYYDLDTENERAIFLERVYDNIKFDGKPVGEPEKFSSDWINWLQEFNNGCTHYYTESVQAMKYANSKDIVRGGFYQPANDVTRSGKYEVGNEFVVTTNTYISSVNDSQYSFIVDTYALSDENGSYVDNFRKYNVYRQDGKEVATSCGDGVAKATFQPDGSYEMETRQSDSAGGAMYLSSTVSVSKTFDSNDCPTDEVYKYTGYNSDGSLSDVVTKVEKYGDFHKYPATAISDVNYSAAKPEKRVYSLQGVLLGNTTDGLPHGVYVVKEGMCRYKVRK